jgi:hypothetical protein
MLIPAFFLILLVGWVLDQIFIEEVETAPVVAKKAVAAAPGSSDQVIRVTRRPATATATTTTAASPAPQTTEVVK